MRFQSFFRTHVTSGTPSDAAGNLTLIRAAEEELIKNKVISSYRGCSTLKCPFSSLDLGICLRQLLVAVMCQDLVRGIGSLQ